jgi:hypothetical protein
MTKKAPHFARPLFLYLPIPEPGPAGVTIDSLALLAKDNPPETSYVPRIVGAMQAAHAAELVPHCVSLASEDASDIAASLEPVVLHSLKWAAISA